MGKIEDLPGDLARNGPVDVAKPTSAADPDLAQAFQDHRLYLKKYLARRLPADQDPEDFTQDVYLRALQFARRENKVENWRGILIRIAADIVTDGFRRRKSRAGDMHVALDSIQEPNDDSVTSPERILQARQKITAVERTLETLDPDCRRAFLLVRFHGYNYAEVAADLAINQVAVGRLIERATLRLTRAAIADQ